MQNIKKTAKGFGDKIQRLEITQRVIRKTMLTFQTIAGNKIQGLRFWNSQGHQDEIP
jgi:hypothetical protein